jgi:hypothetical protein
MVEREDQYELTAPFAELKKSQHYRAATAFARHARIFLLPLRQRGSGCHIPGHPVLLATIGESSRGPNRWIYEIGEIAEATYLNSERRVAG